MSMKIEKCAINMAVSGRGTYPHMNMEPGDAFVVPPEKEKRARFLASYYKKKTGWHFSVRKCKDGQLRTFRIS